MIGFWSDTTGGPPRRRRGVVWSLFWATVVICIAIALVQLPAVVGPPLALVGLLMILAGALGQPSGGRREKPS